MWLTKGNNLIENTVNGHIFSAIYGTMVVHVWCSPHVTLLYLAGLGQCLPPAVAQQYPHVDPILQHEGQSPPECNHV